MIEFINKNFKLTTNTILIIMFFLSMFYVYNIQSFEEIKYGVLFIIFTPLIYEIIKYFNNNKNNIK